MDNNQTSQPPPKADHPFLILKENQFAHTAINRLITSKNNRKNTSKTTPLVFISGSSGSGKSHLLNNILRESTKKSPKLKSLYQTGSQFLETVELATTENRLHDFEQKQTKTDLYLFEDIHTVAKSKKAQQLLITIIDTILKTGGQVAITSRFEAGKISGLISKLVNRLHGGVTAFIQNLSEPSRLKLLTHFCECHHFPIPLDATAHIAKEMDISPRELLATLFQLENLAQFEAAYIDLAFVKKFINHEIKKQKPTISAITKAVAKEFQVSLSDIRSKARHRAVLIPRQIAMFLSRELTDARLSEIGKYFGGRNHTTIIHAQQKMADELPNNPTLEYHLSSVRHRLQGISAKPR